MGSESSFRSLDHPRVASRTIVFGAAFVRPLAACMVPIMIGALVAMLTARPPLPWLTWGFPFGSVVAAAWTILQLRRRTVAVHVRGEAVDLVSAWDITAGSRKRVWLSVLDVRREAERLHVTFGLDQRTLLLRDWPEPDRLHHALVAAMEGYGHRVRGAVETRDA